MYTKESIIALLDENDAAVRKALKTINTVCGWTDPERNFALSLIAQMEMWEKSDKKKRYPTPLSDKQLHYARNLVKKYAAVLARIANEKTRVEQPTWREEDGERAMMELQEQAAERGFHQNGYKDLGW